MINPQSIVMNCDCLEYMATCKDKQFDLAIVDPPYGLNYENGGQYFKKMQGKTWDDKIPGQSYFDELFRISKNQIIWGANYFKLPPTRCVIAWTKTNELKDRNFSEFEMAWTSFDTPARWYNLKPFQRNGSRINPCQKPINLYKWLLKNYAKEGDKIFDSHAGSMSSVIACIDGGFPIVACELDFDYYEAGKKRVMNHMAQLDCFIERPEIVWHNDTHIK